MDRRGLETKELDKVNVQFCTIMILIIDVIIQRDKLERKFASWILHLFYCTVLLLRLHQDRQMWLFYQRHKITVLKGLTFFLWFCNCVFYFISIISFSKFIVFNFGPKSIANYANTRNSLYALSSLSNS